MIRKASQSLIIHRLITFSILLSVIICFYTQPQFYKETLPILAFSIDYHGCLANANHQKQYTQLFFSCEDELSISIPSKEPLLSYNNFKLTSFILQNIYQIVDTKNTKRVLAILLNGSSRQLQTNSPYKINSIDYFKDALLPVALSVFESFLSYMTALFDNTTASCKDRSFFLRRRLRKASPW